MSGLSVGELATRLGGTAAGDVARMITGVSTPPTAGPSDLIFIASARYRGELEASVAGAALLPADLTPPAGMAAIHVRDPTLAMARAIDLLVPVRRRSAGISDRAILGEDVAIGPDACIGPGCCVGDRARIGARTDVRAGATIGADASHWRRLPDPLRCAHLRWPGSGDLRATPSTPTSFHKTR